MLSKNLPSQEKLTAIAAFESTGDLLIARGGTLDQYSQAIDNGVRIAMLYGDRDYMCNCELVDFHLMTTDINSSKQGEVARMLV